RGGGRELAAACEAAKAADNPGAYLGAVIGEAALEGRDKLMVFLPPQLAPLGDWLEQLLAESTGKQGKGIIPIVGEPPGPPERYPSDRMFVLMGDQVDMAGLEASGHPVVQLPFEGVEQIGAEFLRWEFATAVAGQRLGINPF